MDHNEIIGEVAKDVMHQCFKFELILIIGIGAIQLKLMTVFDI